MTLRHIEFAERQTDDCRITRDKFEIGDYKVDRYVKQYENFTFVNFSVIGDRSNEYLPGIEYRDNYFEGKKPEFRIQTTAYGALGLEDIEKVMEGYKQAVEVVKILTLNFC